jgi:hypothetical protein
MWTECPSLISSFLSFLLQVLRVGCLLLDEFLPVRLLCESYWRPLQCPVNVYSRATYIPDITIAAKSKLFNIQAHLMLMLEILQCVEGYIM